jgi:hypothetical protein
MTGEKFCSLNFKHSKIPGKHFTIANSVKRTEEQHSECPDFSPRA